MYFIVEVNTPNKLITYKNREIRTPAKFKVIEKDIKFFKVLLHKLGVEDFSILHSNDNIEFFLPDKVVSIEEINEETTIEIMDDEDETKSVLDQLIKDSKKE